jgi:hypothetical protein
VQGHPDLESSTIFVGESSLDFEGCLEGGPRGWEGRGGGTITAHPENVTTVAFRGIAHGQIMALS